MMAAESSANSSTDDNNTTTILDTKKSKVSSILSPLSFSSTSSAASLSISSQQQEQEQQQQSSSSQSVPNDRSSIKTISSPSLTTTNVFINFPSSCCCRQMMATAKTARTRITAATSATSATTTTIAAGNSSSNNNYKKSIKNGSDSRISGIGGGPSPFRQLLPIALCILSFATVLSILVVYMDTTEIRHQQFRLNMSRDYELHGVSQDNPTLIAFLREIHMKKYPMNFLKNARVEHLNFTEHHGELTPEMANYISSLVGGKMNGAFIQSMTGSTGNVMTGPWLAETLNWSGLLVEPEPRRYFTLRKQNVHRPKVQVVHACVSPSGYPKEVRIHNDDSEVRINSLLDEETSWFNTRVKCFPLYTLMLAINRVDYDLLSLGCEDHELEILQTLPFDKVNVEVISIHLTENNENVTKYVRNISKFLLGKSYKLQRRFDNNYIYQKINSNRTKKQIKSISSIAAATTATTTATKTKTSTTTTTTTAGIAITGTSTTTMTSLIKMQESQQKQHYDKHKRQN